MTTPDTAVEILVVEDDDLVMSVVERTLRHAGYTVFQAYNGEDALALLGLHRDTLRAVYLDLTLPTMPGEEVLAKIRAAANSLPVMLASGHEPRRIGAATLGLAQGFLQKPFRSGELLTALQRVVTR
jgi:two-component system, cell cycle sensor histidine kinase and response regulator CckA